MKQYNFMRDEWDGTPKTIWSRKKQSRLIEIILQKYPEPIDLKNKLLDIDNEESKVLGNYMDPSWSRKEYVKFIQNHVIKYSTTGKIILSQLVGAGLGTLTWWLTGKYWDDKKNSYLSDTTRNIDNDFKNNLPREEFTKKYTTDDLIKAGHEFNYLNKQLPNQNVIKFSPVLSSLTAKGLGSYGTYKLLDLIDK